MSLQTSDVSGKSRPEQSSEVGEQASHDQATDQEPRATAMPEDGLSEQTADKT